MTRQQTIDAIERQRQQRERELALLMLLLLVQVRRYGTHAIRLDTDPLEAMRLVWMGGQHFRGIVNPLARIMADTHVAGFATAARLSESTDGLPDAKALERLYEPSARLAAGQMLDTLQAGIPLMVGQGIDSPRTRLLQFREAFETNGYTQHNPWAIRRAAEANVIEAYSRGMADGFRNGLHSGYRHTSVLDESTTEICDARDGLLLPKDDTYWLTNWPPLHWGCRSIVLPVRGPQEWSTQYPVIPSAPGFGRMPAWMGDIEFYPKAA